jgi:hypothetical protein
MLPPPPLIEPLNDLRFIFPEIVTGKSVLTEPLTVEALISASYFIVSEFQSSRKKYYKKKPTRSN